MFIGLLCFFFLSNDRLGPVLVASNRHSDPRVCLFQMRKLKLPRRNSWVSQPLSRAGSLGPAPERGGTRASQA